MAKIYDAASLPSLQNSVLEMLDTFGMTSQPTSSTQHSSPVSISSSANPNPNPNNNSQKSHHKKKETSTSSEPKIILTHHPHLAERPKTSAHLLPVNISLLPNQITSTYRHLFVKLAEKSNDANSRMEYFASLWRQGEGESGEGQEIEWSHPGLPHPDSIYTYGRLCCDADEGKWNDQSILLETTRSLGSGARVRCFVNGLAQYSFFPGQMIAVEGVPMLDGLHVKRCLPIAPLERPLTSIRSLVQGGGASTEAMVALVASGPFLIPRWEGPEPIGIESVKFDRLLAYCREEKAQVLILMGPFLAEQAQWQLASQQSDFCAWMGHRRLEDLFIERISKELNAHVAQEPGLRIVLVPSLKDEPIHASVLPQAPFDRERLGLDPAILLVGNPCLLLIHSIVFGLLNMDTLFDLSCVEIAAKSNSGLAGDRMSRLIKHLLDQRSLYPIFPPHPSLNLDDAHRHTLHLPLAPDSLILPSQLRHFVRQVDTTLALNPGSLSKGTLARLTIQPLLLDGQPLDLHIPSLLEERARVDIVQI